MTSLTPHMVKAFDDDLGEIRALVAQMGGLVERAAALATKALIEADEWTASSVMRDDSQIHSLCQDVERRCICLIALRAPRANDLREILADFKIAITMARMGGCARSIAEQVAMVRGLRRNSSKHVLTQMADRAQETIRCAIDCFVRRDGEVEAGEASDPRLLSLLQDDLLRDLLDNMADAPATIGSSTCMLLASQKLVRLAEHAASISRICSTAGRVAAAPQPGLQGG